MAVPFIYGRKLKFLGWALIVCAALSSSWASAAPTEPTASTEAQSIEQKASLRLTHLLFSAVLDRYAQEGREKYRPEFLLHDRYLRTFLYEWGLILDRGRATSTQQIWTDISKRHSYLGSNFNVWSQTFPHALGLKDDGFNIGNMRETFLVAVLRSETTPDFAQRSRQILNFTSTYLMTQSGDQELGLKLLEAFGSHSSKDLRIEAAQLVRNFPALSKTITILSFSRDIALGMALTPANLTSVLSSRLSGVVAASGKTAASFVATLRTRLRTAIRFPELLAQWRRSGITRAFAYSGGAHVAGALAISAKMNAEALATAVEAEEAEVLKNAYAQSSPVSFLTAVSLNTASERAQRLLEERDFELPQNLRRDSTRDEWTTEAKQALAVWNQSGAYSHRTPLASVLLEGERLLGFWPENTTLTRLTVESRYARMKKRIQESKITEIEKFREDILSRELEDYRGQRRILTSMMLDWGGNCVSQTLTLVSLLTQFPQVVPQGSQIGVFLSPNHMEAVLLSQDEIFFLVSGDIRARDSSMTIFKPQALLAMALTRIDGRVPSDISSYYLNGRPEPGSQTSFEGGLKSFLAQLYRFDFEKGLASGGKGFTVTGEGSVPYAPKHSVVQYRAGSKTSSGRPAESSFRSILGSDAADERRELQGGNEVPSPRYRIPVENGFIEVALATNPNQIGVGTESYSSQRFSKSVSMDDGHASLYLSDRRRAHFRFQNLTARGVKNLQLTLDPDDINLLRSLPRELWILQIQRWIFEEVSKRLGLENIDSESALRLGHRFDVRAEDTRYLQMRTVERTALFKITKSMGSSTDFSPIVFLRQLVPSLNDPIYQRRYGMKFTNPEAGSAMEQLTILTRMANDYQDMLRRTYKNRPELLKLIDNKPLAQVSARFFINHYLRANIDMKPADFVKAFAAMDPRVKIALVAWGRQMPSDETFESETIDNLRDFLDQFGLKQLKLEQPAAKRVERSLRPDINTYVCKTVEGCAGFSILKKESQVEARGNGKDVAKQEATDQKELRISPADLALLSLMTSGGLQLWNEEVFQAVNRGGAEWVRALGIESFESNQPGANDGLEIWKNLNPKRNGLDYVVRAEKAISEIIRPSSASPSVSSDPRPSAQILAEARKFLTFMLPQSGFVLRDDALLKDKSGKSDAEIVALAKKMVPFTKIDAKESGLSHLVPTPDSKKK